MDNSVWDNDTSTITLTAMTAAGAAVNLSATTTRAIKVRNKATGVVTNVSAIDTNLASGIVSGTITSLGVGTYEAVLRVTDGTGTYTYPTPDVSPPQFRVVADIDA